MHLHVCPICNRRTRNVLDDDADDDDNLRPTSTKTSSSLRDPTLYSHPVVPCLCVCLALSVCISVCLSVCVYSWLWSGETEACWLQSHELRCWNYPLFMVGNPILHTQTHARTSLMSRPGETNWSIAAGYTCPALSRLDLILNVHSSHLILSSVLAPTAKTHLTQSTPSRPDLHQHTAVAVAYMSDLIDTWLSYSRGYTIVLTADRLNVTTAKSPVSSICMSPALNSTQLAESEWVYILYTV